MPWNPEDAERHTKKAAGHPTAKRAFAHAANSVLEETGDEGRAVAAGNAAVNASIAKEHREGHHGQRRYGGSKRR
jgi:hypothetical protein